MGTSPVERGQASSASVERTLGQAEGWNGWASVLDLPNEHVKFNWRAKANREFQRGRGSVYRTLRF